jgi:hypothetical protein
LPQAGAQGQFVERAVAVGLRHAQVAAGFGGGERLEFRTRGG